MRVALAPYPTQYLVLSVFFILVINVGVLVSHYDFKVYFPND